MTREEAKEIFLNRGFIDGIYDGNKWRDACIVISKWLEQEPILDKIKTEIEQEYNRLSATRADETLELGECLGLKMSLKIIDKYKAETER